MSSPLMAWDDAISSKIERVYIEIFVALASRRRFCASMWIIKIAGGTPAPQGNSVRW
jgi:hypothetical protein